MIFGNSFALSEIQQMLITWSLVPLLFLNPACTSGSSQFTYCWSLPWRILSITLLACEMSAVHGSWTILWHCPSLELKWTSLMAQWVKNPPAMQETWVGNPRVGRESRPHPEEPRFSLLAPEEGSFPWVVGKEFPAISLYICISWTWCVIGKITTVV